MENDDRIVKAILVAGALNAVIAAGGRLDDSSHLAAVIRKVAVLVTELEAAIFPREDGPNQGR
jgi:hypothetical protein